MDIRFRLFAFIGWPKIIQSHQRKNNTSIKACIQLSLIWMMHWIYFLNPILKTDVINSTTKIVTRPLTLACNEVTIRNNKTKSRIAWTEKLLIYPDILILTHIDAIVSKNIRRWYEINWLIVYYEWRKTPVQAALFSSATLIVNINPSPS